MKILITGGSGYIGGMLIHQWAERPDVEAILSIDKDPALPLVSGLKKVRFIQKNLSDTSWLQEAQAFAPDVVIHSAWQIRELYLERKKQWHWNIEGSRIVFDFVFGTPSVKKLIHFSTVASYGAYKDNEINNLFTEEHPFRKTDYLYAEEKRITEGDLEKRFFDAKEKGIKLPQVFIVRPAAITGPRGRAMSHRFGLQSALSGKLEGSFIYSMVRFLVSFVPVTPKWCRQFVHEDDVRGILELLTFTSVSGEYEAFNLCPPGPVVLGEDMARAVGKKAIPVSPLIVRIAFFFMWHLSLGKIPTSQGGWKSYSYPIAVDGSKITKKYGYTYLYDSKTAFTLYKGTYAR